MSVISVIMPVCHERPEVVAAAIDSVLAQTFKDFELLVLLDNPNNTDAERTITAYVAKDPRVRALKNPENLGLPRSLNRLIGEAHGEFVARHDADDVSLPRRLELQLAEFARDPTLDVVGTSIVYVDENEKTLFVRRYPRDAGNGLRRASTLAHPTVVARRSLYERFGTYDPNRMFGVEDYDLWIRWHLQGVRMSNLDTVTYRYRQNQTSFKAKHTRNQLRASIRVKLDHRRALGFDPVDYLVLGAEICALALPKQLILATFYQVQLMRARLRRAPGPGAVL